MLEITDFALWYLLFIVYLGIVVGSYIKLLDYGANKYYIFSFLMPFFIIGSHTYKGIYHFNTDIKYSWTLVKYATVNLPISIGVVASVITYNEEKKKRKQTLSEIWRLYTQILDFKVMKKYE